MYRLVKALGDKFIKTIAKALPVWRSSVVEKTFPARLSFRPAAPANGSMLSASLLARLTKPVHYQDYHIYRLVNVHVTWDGAVFHNLRLFEPSIVRRQFLSRFQDTLLLRQWLGQKVKVSGGDIAVCHNQWSTENYYHWLIDSLPRLLALRSLHPGMRLMLPRASSFQDVPEYISSSAALLGFPDQLPINPRQMLSAESVVLPGLTATSLSQRPELIRQVQAELIAALCPQTVRPFRRVYASRVRGLPRNLLNEPEVELWLQLLGFEKVYFEQMSLLEQARLMRETEVLIGVHGAALTNMLFLPTHAKVIEFHNEEYGDPCYLRLASCLELAFYICPCKGIDKELGNQSDIVVDVLALQQMTALAL